MFVCICVGLFINWGNPFDEVNESNFNPSALLMSLAHHEEDLAWKSPLITDKDVLRLFTSFKSCSKLDKNNSNSLLFWLGEQQITDTIIFLLLKKSLLKIMVDLGKASL